MNTIQLHINRHGPAAAAAPVGAVRGAVPTAPVARNGSDQGPRQSVISDPIAGVGLSQRSDGCHLSGGRHRLVPGQQIGNARR